MGRRAPDPAFGGYRTGTAAAILPAMLEAWTSPRSARGPSIPEAVAHARARWRSAHDAAGAALAAWRRSPGPAAYGAYRAAAEREDAAQIVLERWWAALGAAPPAR